MKPRFTFFLLTAALSVGAAHALAKAKETVLHSFGATASDAVGPQDGLIADSAGNLYGTTIAGGDFGKGAVFVVTPGGTESELYSFHGAPNDGEEPNAALAMDKNGVVYGSTLIGGAANKGTVFQITSGGVESVIYSFCALSSCADGSTPVSPIAFGKKGALYGTAELGGLGAVQPNNGVAFRLDPPKHGGAWKETVLYSFCSQSFCADGKFPYGARLLLMADGMLYGTASQSQQGGTLYRVSPAGGGFQVLHTFTTTGSDGQSPINGVVADRSGILYGTTRQGGTHGCGTAYSFDPSSFVYQQIYNFCDQAGDGTTLYGGLTLTDGKHGLTLYGAALAGGAHGSGALFSLAAPQALGDPWQEQTLYSFCAKASCADGATPAFATPLDLQGVFYGTTTAGGDHNEGVVYRYGKP